MSADAAYLALLDRLEARIDNSPAITPDQKIEIYRRLLAVPLEERPAVLAQVLAV